MHNFKEGCLHLIGKSQPILEGVGRSSLFPLQELLRNLGQLRFHLVGSISDPLRTHHRCRSLLGILVTGTLPPQVLR
jgi:hypothetical protein